jgi:ABC-2 type transport system permease protein
MAEPSTSTAIDPAPLVLVAERRSLTRHVADLVRYRDLLQILVRKELKIRYRNSTLGFLWSMAQPVFMLVVYTAVFAILGAGFERFAIWVLSGLIVWTLVSTSLMTATQSITANAPLVGKVRFPRAVLPLSSVGAATVHFVLQMIAFFIVLALTRHDVDWAYVPLLPLAFVTCLVWCMALAILLAPLNVIARDTQHLLELAILAWFWATPILYQYDRAADWVGSQGVPGSIILVNPFTPVIITFQRALYGAYEVGPTDLLPSYGVAWYLLVVVLSLLASVVALAVALWLFERREPDMVEML